MLNELNKKKYLGFSLMEVIISMFVIMILTLGIYSLIILSLKLTADNKAYVAAIEIANQKMEQIRNLPYGEVGVQGGTPDGNIPQIEIINREETFTINTYVIYYDDPYDGEAGSSTAPDAIINDYKIATIKVSWQSKYGLKTISVFSKIIPRTMETLEGHGLLVIRVADTNANPLANANVRVVNNSLTPTVDVVNQTDQNGLIYFPVLAAYQSYEITITKTDEEGMGIYYGTDMSFHSDTNLTPIHLSASQGEKNEEGFIINKLANLRVKTVSDNSLPDNWLVNKATSTNNKTNVHFSLDSSDNMHFTWEESTATGSRIYAQKYSQAAARQWGFDRQISTSTFQTNPDIVTAASGDSFIVWQDNSTGLKTIDPFAFQPGNRLAQVKDKKKSILTDNNKLSISPAAISDSSFSLSAKNFISRLTALFNKLKNKSLVASQKISKLYKKITARTANFTREKFKTNKAKAAGAIVQTAISSNVGGNNTMTATFGADPLLGNVIIAIAVHSNNYNAFNTPTNTAGNFTKSIYSNIAWYLDAGIWHKVVMPGGGQDAITITANNNMDGGVLMIMEISGLDINNLIDTTAYNDETWGNSLTATTGSTTPSAQTGFAIAAIAFADNNFTTPDSSNWSSGSSDNWTHVLWDDWSTSNDGSLAVATLDISSSSEQRATLTLSGGGSEQRNSVLAIYNLAPPYNAMISATGNQTATTTIPSVNYYVGGAFVISEILSASNVTDITIAEQGTVDAQNNLSNVRLYYDLDISAPYDCVSEQYDAGVDLQFGASASFNGNNGTSTFNAAAPGIEITTAKTMCVYVVLDVDTGAIKNETLKIKINNPSSDVIISTGNTTPAASVEIPGTTHLLKPVELQQIHYRWRNDNGTETGASWKTTEDTSTTITEDALIRLRFEIVNDSSFTSDSVGYRIEYGKRISTCANVSADSTWVPLPNDNSQHWKMDNSSYFTDGNATVNIAGLTDENINFKSGESKDAGNQTSPLVLTYAEFTEIEYAIKATSNATDSNYYCFRLTNAGSTADFNYLTYPEIIITGDENIYLINVDSNGNLGTIKKVNSDSTNENQTNPRIAITNNSATTTIVWQDNRNGNSDIYAQSFSATSAKLWAADLQITASSTEEHSPVAAVDSNNDVIVAWVEDDATDQNIYLQKYDLNKNQIWPSHKRVVNSGFDEYAPEIAVDSSNNIYLSWTENVAGVKNVSIAQFNSNGIKHWEKQANIEALSDDQYEGAIALYNTLLYVSWTDDRETNEDIYAQKYALDGTAQWTKDLRINIHTCASTQNNSSLIINSLNEPFVSWQDDRDDAFNIYAAKFNDPGVITDVPNVPIIVTGTKLISATPVIHEYKQEHITDAAGLADLAVEWDTGYSVALKTASTSLDIILRDPIQPLGILPDETKTWLIYVK